MGSGVDVGSEVDGASFTDDGETEEIDSSAEFSTTVSPHARRNITVKAVTKRNIFLIRILLMEKPFRKFSIKCCHLL